MRAIVSLLLVATTVGCGSGAQSPAPSNEGPPAASAGAETTPEPPAQVEPEPEVAAPEPPSARPTGRGTLVLVASIANKEVAADVRVLNDAGEEQAKAQSGEPINLPAGNYELEVSIHDASVMADTPTQRRELVLQGGQNARVEARFRWAKVQLDVRVNGRSQPGAKVQLIREDEVVAEVKSGAPPTPI